MNIRDEHMLEINMVYPEHEDLYAKRKNELFLDRKLGHNLKLDKQTTLKPPQLKAIWRNTKLFVIRPKSGWYQQIEAYLNANR